MARHALTSTLTAVTCALFALGCSDDVAESFAGDRSAVHYIATNGTDSQSCDGGTRANPWKTWKGSLESGCIKAGDTVYFMAGTYRTGAGIFAPFPDPRATAINLEGIEVPGERGKPVVITVDPDAPGEWPVRFEGVVIFQGDHGIIQGIEFDASKQAPLPKGVPGIVGLAGSYLELRESYVHGGPDIKPDGEEPGFDCVKLTGNPATGMRSEGIRVIDNVIAHCVRDCIDVTGSRDVVYRNNTIHTCYGLSIKGGTEDIVVEQNTLTGCVSPIVGSNMRGNNGVTTGSPLQPTLPVEERFTVRNLTVRNNIIAAAVSNVFSINGYRDVFIQHNTVATVGEAVLFLGKAGFDFRDGLAKAYCQASPEKCGACIDPAEANCWFIAFPSKNVHFQNNIIGMGGAKAAGKIAAVYVDVGASLQGFEAAGNVYFDPTGSTTFEIGDPGHALYGFYGLAEFPFESGSREQDPGLASPSLAKLPLDPADFVLRSDSVAIDRGMALGVALDFSGNPRDASPDVGALEHPQP